MVGSGEARTSDQLTWNTSLRDGEPIDLKIDRPHSARVYDYLLGGKDNFPADRDAAEQAARSFPNIRNTALQNRAFMVRAIRCLVADAGIRRFLDVGTGIPTSPNLHEIAQAVAPDTRVVYTDNDPIALAQASGFRLQASGFRLQASGFRLQASGFRLQASGFRLQASGF